MNIEEMIAEEVKRALAESFAPLKALVAVQLDNNELLRAIAGAVKAPPPAAPAPTPVPSPSTPPSSPAPTPQPPDPAVPSANGTIGETVNHDGSVWTITKDERRSILRDGVAATNPDLTSGVVALARYNDQLYQVNSSSAWYRWSGVSDWEAVADPRPKIQIDISGGA